MSDAKAMNLTSLVTKKTRRAKARLMQNFGKADKTTDELFEVYQINFNRQQTTALSLQKHVKHYLHCLKELHEASKGLSQCLLELHEKEWPKHEVLENNAYEMEHISEDLEEKLKESVLIPLEQYIGQFAEMREKISKRGRKLVDYDSQRHTYEALQQQHRQPNSSIKQQGDDSKLAKSRDHLEEARRVYESLNNELHDELPALYDNRLPFIITVFQRLFASKISYHSDSLAIQKSYLETVELLAKASEKGEFTSKISPSLYRKKLAQNATSAPSKSSTQSSNGTNKIAADAIPHVPSTTTNSTTTNTTTTTTTAQPVDSNTTEAATTTTNKAPVYLHKVRATYKYMAEDEDELGFEAGEIIQVIEYDDPQEQEEGWLMGIKESDGQKGLFPANFTKEI